MYVKFEKKKLHVHVLHMDTVIDIELHVHVVFVLVIRIHSTHACNLGQ